MSNKSGAENTKPDPIYVGSTTFMDSERIESNNLSKEVDIAAVGVPFDGGVANQPGARYGPEKLRRESGWYARNDGGFNAATGHNVDYSGISMKDCGNVPVITTDIKETGDRIQNMLEEIAASSFPVILGGDHYITYPSFCGVAKARGERLGMVHLDAHTDIYGSWDSYGKHWHGSPMNLINETEHGSYETHSMVGLRAIEDANFPEFAEENGLHVSYAHDIHERGIVPCIADAINHAAQDVDGVYLTVDIDIVDPTMAPGTGTPEFGGINPTQLLNAMEYLGGHDSICAIDLVEVAPRLDPSRMTPRLGAAAISRFLEFKFGNTS